jgi:ABC-type Zn uptake system ZnuABC Zn-binding protein ZnuA
MEAIMQKEVQTANDTLEAVKEDHKHNPIYATTTPGIYATQDYLQAQINALADYIDGKRVEVIVTQPKQSEVPVLTKATATAPAFVPSASTPVYQTA